MFLYTVQRTWIKAAFHVFPDPVLYWANKLPRAHLSVNLGRRNEAHLGSVNISMNNCSYSDEGETSVREAFARRSTASTQTAHLPLNQILNILHEKRGNKTKWC